MAERIKKVLKDLKSGRISHDRALYQLKDLPYQDLGFAKVDNHRSLRRGFPEVIFGKGKTCEQIIKISEKILKNDGILLITQTDKNVFSRLKKLYPKAAFNKEARIISYRNKPPILKNGTVLII